MVKIRVASKADVFLQKLHFITKKCAELSDQYPYFSWEFFTVKGKTYFTACYRDGDETQRFEFPIENLPIDEKYTYIIDQLNELKWSAIFWKKEERHGAEH